MKDFEPIIYDFPDRKDIVIYPISDVHIGAEEMMLKVWNDFKKKLLSEPNSYITIGGDMMNNGIKSSVTNVYAETMRPREQKKWLVEQLEDVKHKILCVVPGNHENRNDREVDNNPLYDVCCKLDIEDKFKENAAFVIMRFGNIEGNGENNPSYTMCVLHGSGGGIYTGAAVNRNERFGYTMDNLDVLVVGHNHKPTVSKPQKIFIDARNKKVSFKPFTVVSSTSWLSYGGYALRKQLLPASHSLQEIQLKGKRKEVRVLF
ncbi:MAG: metallophosphoesterase [Candidatus Dehalobacter alkaniphilus]